LASVKEVLLRQIEAARGALDQLEEHVNGLGRLHSKPALKVSVAVARFLEALDAAQEKGLGTPKN
jgi:hypothetical protein